MGSVILWRATSESTEKSVRQCRESEKFIIFAESNNKKTFAYDIKNGARDAPDAFLHDIPIDVISEVWAAEILQTFNPLSQIKDLASRFPYRGDGLLILY